MESIENFAPVISSENPLQDYKTLMKKYVEGTEYSEGDLYQTLYAKIAEVARNRVWSLLFDKTPPTEECMKKAEELLVEHRSDAAFYSPWDYNDFIVLFRDELLKRKMFDFWRDVIVKKELGLCWARDCDYFDDADDEAPKKFYEYAGCKAPFEKAFGDVPSGNSDSNEAFQSPNESSCNNSVPVNINGAKIGFENPLDDYAKLIKANENNTEALKAVFSEAQKTIWELIFKEEDLSEENSKKASELLIEYRRDACFDDPFGYNAWIPKVRDELFKRKLYSFWKVIVDNKLGLCSRDDSDYFDDSSNTDHIEFLKSGDAFLQKSEA